MTNTVRNRGGVAHKLRAAFEADPAAQLTYQHITERYHITYGRAREVVADLKREGLDLETVFVVRMRRQG